METWAFLWVVGAMFTDGLKDPDNKEGFICALVRFFKWPWELGQFVFIITRKEPHND